MGLNASKVKNDFGPKVPPLDSGNYPGRVLHVLDLGLQPQRPYLGKEKPPTREIMVQYELSDEFIPDEDGEPQEDKPRLASDRFPLRSLDSEKAKSTKRYKVLDPDTKYGGDFSKTIGCPVSVMISRDEKPDGKVYNNVGGISPLRPKDAAKLPDLVNDPIVFDLDDPDIDAFKKLPDWIKKIISGNLEFEGSKLQKLLDNDEDYKPTDTSDVEASDERSVEDDDENPY